VPEGVKCIYSDACLCKLIDSVELPDTLECISESAFCGCKFLRDIKFGSSLKSVGAYAFSGCEKLEMVDFRGTSLQFLDNNAFSRCFSLMKVLLPDKMSDLGSYVFSDCISLPMLEFPYLEKEHTLMLEYITKGCTGLKNVVLPEGLTYFDCRVSEGIADDCTVSLPSTLRHLSIKGNNNHAHGSIKLEIPKNSNVVELIKNMDTTANINIVYK
jgi:hypothetical protein